MTHNSCGRSCKSLLDLRRPSVESYILNSPIPTRLLCCEEVSNDVLSHFYWDQPGFRQRVFIK